MTRRAYITVPPSRIQEIKQTLYDLAVRRTAQLERQAFRTSPEELLVSAYLQGLTDAVTTLDKADLLK